MRLTPIKLGVTGGVASGKSTVAALLTKNGAALIDADAISHQITQAQGAAIAPLRSLFGSAFLTTEGALDRQRMRHLIYEDSEAKLLLENVLHPLIRSEMLAQIDRTKDTGVHCVVLDIPLLVESKYWRKNLDCILVVDCTEQAQQERLMRRNGLSIAEASQIIGAQEKRSDRLCAADLVLLNENSSLEILAQQVQEIGTQFGL